MAPLKNVVVVGASKAGMSNLGFYIAQALVADASEFNVSIISRQSSTAETPAGVNVIKVADSYPSEDLEKAFSGQDAVVMANGFHLMGQDDKFIDAAVKVGVKRFIPSDFGSNTRNEKTLAIFPMVAAKAKIAQSLRAKESTGLSWTVISTGIFTDIGIATGFMGIDIKGHKATIWDDGNHKFSSSTRPQVGKAVAAVLKNPEITSNQHVYVSSYEISYNDIVAVLEKAQGTKYTISSITTEEATAQGREAMAKGDFMGAGKLLMVANLNDGYGNNFAKEEELWNDKIGLGRESLDDAIAHILSV